MKTNNEIVIAEFITSIIVGISFGFGAGLSMFMIFVCVNLIIKRNEV